MLVRTMKMLMFMIVVCSGVGMTYVCHDVISSECSCVAIVWPGTI